MIDLAPTLVSLARGKIAPSFQGRSFEKLLTHPTKEFRTYVFAEHNWHDYEAYERMICTKQFLFIENSRPQLTAEGAIDVMGSPTGQTLKDADKQDQLTALQKDIFIAPRSRIELYDRINDPDQINNIAKTQTKESDALQKILHQWQDETGDTTPSVLTPDWYSRETLKALPETGKRGEMPGEAKQARWINVAGAF